ncbi:MAG: polyprenyl synthetase family protein [bacterium]
MSESSFPDFFQEQRNRVDQALDQWLPSEDEDPALLNQSMRYSIFNGGKRLRGVLVREAGRLGASPQQSVLDICSASIEMIHAYSLIHDDLPAMDDDDYRRGHPTNHREYGEDIAILAGDALLTRAFEILGQLSEEGLDKETTIRAITLVGSHSGGLGLIGGQVGDLTVDPEQADVDVLQDIHERKTGALMALSLQLGGLAGGLNGDQLTALESFGRKIGLAFQIKDDLLELEGDVEQLGKDANSDRDGDKLTYPRLLGKEKASNRAEELLDQAGSVLEGSIDSSDRLLELARFVLDRNH